MRRREFLTKAVPAGLFLPSLINGFSIKAFGASSLLSAITAASEETDHVLVIIQLNGGNDGLNMILPLDNYDNLALARPNIIMPQNKILKLGNYDTGINPKMTGIANLFAEDKVKVVQSVSYPNPSFSHFRATDIWLTAADSNKVLDTGWAGRYLDQAYENFPVGYPNATMPDPLAIQIGSFLSPSLLGPSRNMGMAISNPTNFYNLLNGIQSPAPNTNAGKELTYIRQISQQTNQYGQVVKNAAAKVPTQGAYPSGNTLADQLKIVSRLIAGGLKTRIYMVNINGFDTHVSQVDDADRTIGSHPALLQKVSDAIKAFMDDSKALGTSKRIVGMTFSEFGRRIKSNDGRGTDHGEAAPMILFGDAINPGILGTNPTIKPVTTVNDNVPMQFDFRSVYASLLEQWFNVDKTVLNNVMLKDFQSLPLIKPEFLSDSTLPITLVNFATKKANEVALLTWSTTQEKNNNYFELERSIDGVKFEFLAKVKSQGDSTHLVNYSYTDNTPVAGVNYYRLSQIDFNNTRKELGIQALNFSLANVVQVKIYPNPAVSSVTVDFESGLYHHVEIYNSSGVKIATQALGKNTASIVLDISSFALGVYIVRLTGAGGTISKKISKI